MKTVAGSCLIGVKKETSIKQGEQEVCGIFLNGYLRRTLFTHLKEGLQVCKYRKFNCDVTTNVAKCGNLRAKESSKNNYNKNYTSQLWA